ncbi:MAG: D-alanyl-D-alanine carboxypeptidase/D-alanyl-D-alanine-endopeptidase [Pseudomonadota bacterium]
MRTILSRLTIISILLLLLDCKVPAANESINSVQLKEKLTELFNSSDAKNIFWGVRVTLTDNNQELFSLNKVKRFRPASNMKVVIAAAALQALSSEYRFETKLFNDGKNLVIVGGGDPTFTSQHFDPWIWELKKRDIKRINGDIIGIDSIFDDQKIGLLWSWDDLSNCYSAQVSGLQINNNCVELSLYPGQERYAKIKKHPDTQYVNVINSVRVTDKKSSLSFKRKEDSNNLFIDGEMNYSSPTVNKWVSVNNPTLYFTTLFYEALKNEGITVSGRPVDARDTGYALNRKTALLITSAKSPPLKYIINDFLKYSINLYGESFIKLLGFIYFNEGNTYNGRLAVNLIFKKYELPEDILFIADGSGLSMLNLISPDYMTQLLHHISKSYYYHTFFNALSTSGMSGTLRRRLDSPELKGHVHAKTGYIKNVRTLSGYVDTVGGQRLTFAIFANNYENRLENAESVINKACSLMRLYKD